MNRYVSSLFILFQYKLIRESSFDFRSKLVSKPPTEVGGNAPRVFQQLVNSKVRYRNIFIRFVNLLVVGSTLSSGDSIFLERFQLFSKDGEMLISNKACYVGYSVVELFQARSRELGDDAIKILERTVSEAILELMMAILSFGKDTHGHAFTSVTSKAMLLINSKLVNDGKRIFLPISEICTNISIFKYIQRLMALRLNMTEKCMTGQCLSWVSRDRIVTTPWIEICEVANMARKHERDGWGSKITWLDATRTSLRISRNQKVLELVEVRKVVGKLVWEMERLMGKILGKVNIPATLVEGFFDDVNNAKEGYWVFEDQRNQLLVSQCWNAIAGILAERSIIQRAMDGKAAVDINGKPIYNRLYARELENELRSFQKFVTLYLHISGGLLCFCNSCLIGNSNRASSAVELSLRNSERKRSVFFFGGQWVTSTKSAKSQMHRALRYVLPS